jgi:prolyl oligopeptidase PreP (S9A serine peptidase family)
LSTQLNLRLVIYALILLTLSQTVFAGPAEENLRAVPVNNYVMKQAAMGSAKAKINQLLEVFPGTKSNKYQWLEMATEKRSEFLAKTRTEAAEKLFQSPLIEKIKATLTPTPATEESDLDEVKISDTRKIHSTQFNFVRKVYDVDGDQKTEIASNQDFAPRQAYLHGLFPSPDKKIIALAFAIDGSIDNITVKFYDVASKKLISEIEMFSGDFGLNWFSNTQVIYTHGQSSSKGESTVIENVITGEQQFKINYGKVSSGDWIGYTDFSTDDLLVQNLKTSQVLVYKNLKTTSIETESEAKFFLTANYSKELAGGIYSLEKQNNANLVTFAEPIANSHLNAIQTIKRNGSMPDVLMAQYIHDAESTIVVYNLDGTIERQATIPADFSFQSMTYDKDSIGYFVIVNSVNDKLTVLKWPLGDSNLKIPAEAYLPKDKAEFEVVSRIEYFKSADGELIPARITHKKDLLMTGSVPVFMDAYGGFMLQGYLAPVTNKIRLEFVKRGGIVVGTGIRGGSERGYAWYQAGTGQNKIKSSEDLIAIARGLVERGYTQADKIAMTGTSNGGYVVASAARMAPEAFGLVIPMNGVQDQLDFSSLDRWGIGWEDDYTNPYSAKSFPFIMARSPLEVKFQGKTGVEFLIINGENDTRVNKVHSYKLKALLDDNLPGKSVLYSVDHAGHWATSTFLLDNIGIKANSIMWAHIYEFLGMDY